MIFYITRHDKPGERKQFIPWSWDSTSQAWVNKQFPDMRPIYGLHLLRGNQKPILIVEGEKTCDALRPLAGHVYNVISWPGGASAFSKVDWDAIVDRKILIWPDADEPGIKAADAIGKILAISNHEVKIIDTKGHTGGWDAADAIASGMTWKDIIEWAKPRAKLLGIHLPAPKPKVERIPPDMPPEPPTHHVHVTVSEEHGLVSGSAFVEWERLGLAMTNKNAPIYSTDNVKRILERHESIQGTIWFDEFHNKIFTKSGHNGSAIVREWNDIDTISLTVRFQRDLGLHKVTKFMVEDAIQGYAHDNKRNEPRDWINSLTWDETPRAEMFLVERFGCEDTPFNRAVSRNFLVSIAARILKPGCKVDNMVVFEGAQGLYKSTAIKALASPAWYAEINEPMGSKDFLQSIQGKLVIELAELDSLNRSDASTIKKVLSTTTDRFRPSYGRATQDFPRRCVFVGTTNDDEYMRDATGGRRFWPVSINSIDIEGIQNDRTQLFAEAAHMLRIGQNWWEVPQEQAEFEQENRRQSDAWEDAISTWLIGRNETTVLDVARLALMMDISDVDKLKQMRIANSLRAAGWRKVVTKVEGKSVKKWRVKSDDTVVKKYDLPNHAPNAVQ